MEQSEQDVLMFHERNHEVEDDLSKVLKKRTKIGSGFYWIFVLPGIVKIVNKKLK